VSGRHRKPDAEQVDEPLETEAPPAHSEDAPPQSHSTFTEHVGATSPEPTPSTSPTPVSSARPDVTGVRPATQVVPRRSRAAERAERRSRTRKRLMTIAGAALVVALLVVGALALLGGRDGGKNGDTSAEPPRQDTVLVQVVRDDGVAAVSALVGVTEGEDEAAAVLVPSGVLAEVPGSGAVPFGEATALGELDAPIQALTDLTGARVDNGWVMTRGAMAGLVDAIGGVRVSVDTDITRTQADGDEVVVVRAGTQDLGGEAAASYATFAGDDEPDQARLARFDNVLTAVVEKLPEDSGDVQAILEALQGTRSTLEVPALADWLVRLRAAAEADEFVSDVLPVNEIDAGGTVPTYGLAVTETSTMIRRLLPGALQTAPDGEVLSVLVENGVGTPGLNEQARELLVAAGFRYVPGGNAAEFNDEPSAIFVPDGTEESIRRGRQVAEALNLPASAVVPSNRGQTIADVIVVLGPDFAGSTPAP
jgi:anionic cell wall polymer biosynthesis LytR-Cps2A-Psr (LCP) family protein